MKRTFRLAALGCRTNQYELQAFQDQLLAAGYAPASEGQAADLCIINTCTVTDNADSRSRHMIRKMVRQNPGTCLIVTGCSVEAQKERIEAIDGVSHVIGNDDKEKLLSILFPDEAFPEFAIKSFEGHTRAFLKVQDGCNSFCTYCIIPYVRGRSRSRARESILAEVQALVANGYKELVITGINVGDYDGGGDDSLADLIRAIDKVEGVERIRVSSIDPDDVNDDLVDAIVNGEHTCHSMHLVLQSGSNSVLKKMNRKYTRQDFFDAAKRLLQACPEFTFTTDAIVGFPGETEEDFEETLEVIRNMQFAKVHLFPYSERPRTRAATYDNKVAGDVVQKRQKRALQEAEKSAFALREQYVGKEVTILTEKGGDVGHTDTFVYCTLQGEPAKENELVEVVCIANGPEGLTVRRRG